MSAFGGASGAARLCAYSLLRAVKKKLSADAYPLLLRKRSLPKYPQRITQIRSFRPGAVIRNPQHPLSVFPGLHIQLYPAAVQGEGWSIRSVAASAGSPNRAGRMW